MKSKKIMAMTAVLWIGMILAIGMESIVKFNAESLLKPVGFDVGRVVFAAFNQVQIMLLAFLILLARIAKVGKLEKIVVLFILIILALQIYWLFPELSKRVDMILMHVQPPPTYKHALYGSLEIIKLIALLALSIRLMFSATKS